MSVMQQVYREVIVEHSRRPRRHGVTNPCTHRQEGLNPSCGDELELTLNVVAGVIEDARFTGQGCAISQASADLMAEALLGLEVSAALGLSAAFKEFIRGNEPEVDLGELRALEGVRQLHARVKCATLPWTTLDGALSGTQPL